MMALGTGEKIASGAEERRRMVTNSRAVAGGIMASRIAGFARITITAAILGPTYFSNFFQTALALTSVFYSMLIGALISELLVPQLVRRIRGEGVESVRRFANATLGLIVVVLAALSILAVIFVPLLLTAFLTIGSAGDTLHGRYIKDSGVPLLLMMMPQIVLYGICGTAAAVQQAYGRFALASAAPALESVAMVGVLSASAALFGTGVDFDTVTMPQLILLGLGTTAAVALHAAVQWWGAYRVAVPLRPRFGWRDPDVRRLFRQSVSSVGYTGQYWAAYFMLLMVSATVPGGVSAFLIAHSCCHLPVVLAAKPFSAVQLPHLAACFFEGKLAEFRAIYESGLRMALFFALPASFALAVIPMTFAHALAFGTMGTPAGVALVGLCIGGMALGVTGEAVVTVSTSASYARSDARTPVNAMALRLAVACAGAAIAQLALSGAQRVWLAGGAMAAANLVAGGYLYWRMRERLPESVGRRQTGFLAGFAISAISVLPAVLVADWFGGVPGTPLRHVTVAAAAVIFSAALYVVLRLACGSQEMRILFPFSSKGAAEDVDCADRIDQETR